MKRILSVLALSIVAGCAAHPDESDDQSDEPIASDDQALGTTSTPGVAVWTRTQPLFQPTIAHVAADPSGRVLYAGGPHIGSYTSSGSLTWYRSIGLQTTAVASDPESHMLLTGTLATDAMPDANPDCAMHGNAWGSSAIAVFDSSSRCIRAKAFNYGDGDLGLRSVASDSAGNIYIGGPVFSEFDLGCGPSIAYFGSIVIAKLGPDLSCKWQRIFQEKTSDESVESNIRFGGLTADPNGNVYAVGQFRNAIDFGGGLMTSQGSMYTEQGEAGPFQKRHMVGYLLKLSSSGTYVWAKQLGTNADATAVTASATRVAVGGEMLETMNIGSHSTSTTASSPDIYVAKLDQYGNDLWLRHFYGTAGQTLGGIAFDQYGYVDVTGSFQTSSTTVTRTFSIGSHDYTVANAAKKMFLTKLGNASGSTIWAKSYGSSTGHVAPGGIATAPDGRIFVGGAFDGTVDFGSGSVTASEPTSFMTKFFQ
jgi:hypothetical protein